MKYNLIVSGNAYKQLTYSEIILYIRKLILNEVSIDFSIELKNSNVIEGIDKFINTGGIKIQTLNFSCIKGLCSFTGLNNISCHWFHNNNIKDLHVYSPCSLTLISVFKNIIESTKKMRYRNKAHLPFKLDMYKRGFKNNINAQKELLISSSF